MNNLIERINDLIYPINELKVIGKPRNGAYIISFRENLWIMNSDSEFKKYRNEIVKKLKIDLDPEDIDGIDDIVHIMGDDENPDVVYGYIKDDVLEVPNYGNFQQSVSTSKQMKKILDYLKLNSVKYNQINALDDSDVEDIQFKAKFRNNLKDVEFFHGTNTLYIDKILKSGIKPTDSTGNWEMKFPDRVFITSSKSYAGYHAISSAEKKNAFPIILSFKIPDVSKLVIDYDVAISFYGIDHPESIKLGYSKAHKNIFKKGNLPYQDTKSSRYKRQLDGKEDINTKLGFFGYMGRIPANHINYTLIDDNGYEEFLKNTEFGIDIDYKKICNPSIDDWSEYKKGGFIEFRDQIQKNLYPEEDDDTFDNEYSEKIEENGAAGLIIVAKKSGKVLFLKRSGMVENPYKWIANVSGAID